jgi:hypothetical protein
MSARDAAGTVTMATGDADCGVDQRNGVCAVEPRASGSSTASVASLARPKRDERRLVPAFIGFSPCVCSDCGSIIASVFRFA